MKPAWMLLLISLNANADYILESAIALHFADWYQTSIIVKDKKYTETNPILGKNPSMKSVNYYFAASGLILTGIHYILPGSLKKQFRMFWLINNAIYIANNYSIGIKFKF